MDSLDFDLGFSILLIDAIFEAYGWRFTTFIWNYEITVRIYSMMKILIFFWAKYVLVLAIVWKTSELKSHLERLTLFAPNNEIILVLNDIKGWLGRTLSMD